MVLCALPSPYKNLSKSVEVKTYAKYAIFSSRLLSNATNTKYRMTNESLQIIMAYRLAAHDFISEFAFFQGII